MSSHYQLEDYAAIKGISERTVARAIITGQLPIRFDEMGYPYLSLRDNIGDRPNPNLGGQNDG